MKFWLFLFVDLLIYWLMKYQQFIILFILGNSCHTTNTSTSSYWLRKCHSRSTPGICSCWRSSWFLNSLFVSQTRKKECIVFICHSDVILEHKVIWRSLKTILQNTIEFISIYDYHIMYSNSGSEVTEKRKLTPREKRFIKFASVEYDGQIYMTPQDFLESVVEGEPRPRFKRKK